MWSERVDVALRDGPSGPDRPVGPGGNVAPARHPYRPDIDGLRGVAVLLVVAFHLFPSRLRGGFVGVDVFFVISGFLITRIVLSDLEGRRFRIGRFYGRRVRRILPSLIVVMAAALAFGLVALFAGEFAHLGKHVAAGAAFVSNFVLRREAGYFDPAAETKPLLHLWSLAVEEQFYLFWPVALLVVRGRRWRFLAVIAAVGLLSFGAGLFLLRRDPVAAFYWPVGRFWELMLGGLLAYLSLRSPRRPGRRGTVRALAGLSLLALGVFLIDGRSPFPGWWALLPTLGTFLILSAGPEAWPNRVLLSVPVLVWVGLVSYPLYLWHWMLLVFARTMAVGDPSATVRLGVALASALLAWATYALVEGSARRSPSRYVSLGLVVALAAVGVAGYGVWRSRGLDGVGIRGGARGAFVRHFENALPEWRYLEREGVLAAMRNDCNFYDIELHRQGRSTTVPLPSVAPACYRRDPRFERSVFIWGDSHAQQFRPGIEGGLPATWQILQVATSRCPPAVDEPRPETHHCGRSNRFALQAIAEARPDVVVLARARGHDVLVAQRIAQALRARGVRRVILVGPVPQWSRDLPLLVARRLWPETPRRTFVGSLSDVLRSDAELRRATAGEEGLVYASPIAYFCDGDGCLVHRGEDRTSGLTTYDYGHLTLDASRAFGRDVLVPLIVEVDHTPRPGR